MNFLHSVSLIAAAVKVSLFSSSTWAVSQLIHSTRRVSSHLTHITRRVSLAFTHSTRGAYSAFTYTTGWAISALTHWTSWVLSHLAHVVRVDPVVLEDTDMLHDPGVPECFVISLRRNFRARNEYEQTILDSTVDLSKLEISWDNIGGHSELIQKLEREIIAHLQFFSSTKKDLLNPLLRPPKGVLLY